MFNSGGGYGFDLGALLGNMMNGRNSGGSGWGDGNGWWVLIILFALFGGWGNRNQGGAGGGDSASVQGALTRGDLCMDMNFNNLQNAVRNVENGVSNGFANLNSTICQQQYDTASMFNAANISNLQAFNALQALISQCCCDEKSLFAQAEYNRATDTCAITNAINQAARDIIQNDNCNYRQLHDENVALQMQNKDAQIAALQGALNKCDNQNLVNTAVQSVVNQVRPTPGPAWVVPNPYANYANYGYNYGYNGGCGCGNNSNIFGAVV